MKKKSLAALMAVIALVGAACATDTGGGGTGGPTGNIVLGTDCTSSPNVVAGARLGGCDLVALGITSLAGLNLTGIDLHGANLAGVDFSNANLSGANLRSSNLTGANLTSANLTGADLSGALLFGALLVGAILFQTIFGVAPVPHVTDGSGGSGGSTPPVAPPDGVGGGNQAWNDRGEPWCAEGTAYYAANPDLRSARTDALTDFSGATFTDNEISGLDFRTGNFENATFLFRDSTESTWQGCLAMAGGRFKGATFVGNGMAHWDYRNADLRQTKWIHTWLCLGDFSGSDLEFAMFIGGGGILACLDYSEQGWPGIDRYSARFNGADLHGARFGGADEIAAPYTDSYFGTGPWYLSLSNGVTKSNGADFAGADLTGATFGPGNFMFSSFAGATTTGITVEDPGSFISLWGSADFGTGGWAGATWHGILHNFIDAICPDGSAGSNMNPCFTLVP